MSRPSAIAAAAAFATLAALVAAGAFTGLDQWAVDHAMPGAHFGRNENGLLQGLVPLYGSHWGSAWDVAVNVVTLPAALLVSLAIVLLRSRLLAVLLVAAVAVETLCKHVLERPHLHHGAARIAAFDSSFPSGHALRTVVVAAAVGGPWAVLWAAASVGLLELAGWHTPSDLLGGLVLGALALLGARAARALGRPRARGARARTLRR